MAEPHAERRGFELSRAADDGRRLRVLRRLGVRDARLWRGEDGDYRIESGGNVAREPVAADLVDALRAADLLAGEGEAFVLSDAGSAFLRRALAGGDGFRAQHQDIAAATVVDDAGALRQVKIDRSESPLSWLRHRRGRDGRPMIDAVEYAAGERLRSDYTRGRMMPRVTANWSAAVAGHRRDGGAGGMAEFTDAVVAARRRVERALDAVGPEFGGLLVDFCCFLKGLEDIEREHHWPSRSAKVVLRLGLSALARHYGLAAKARGRAGAATILHWGADDYRPVME